MKAGAASKDVTPPKGCRLAGHTRHSTGTHDPLLARALVLDDGRNPVAIVGLDICWMDMAFCDEVVERIRRELGIGLSLINSSHTHSAPPLLGAPYVPVGQMDPPERRWSKEAEQAVVDVVAEAYSGTVEVSLHAGRAPVQIGSNRRLPPGETSIDGHGPVVPWVNVLAVRESGSDCEVPGRSLAVLFEHACHPVIVHSASSEAGSDYCGHAISRIQEEMGEDVTPIFVQGCGADINGSPLCGGHDSARLAGRKLGEAVLGAVSGASLIAADEIRTASRQAMLPCQDPPDLHQCFEIAEDMDRALEEKRWDWFDERRHRGNRESQAIVSEIARNGEKRALRFDAHAVMLGDEWCLVAMPHEMLSAYEFWADEQAPFKSTMVLGYTNGCESYVATDADLARGVNGGYEAGNYPMWTIAAATYPIRLPLAVGAEARIRETVSHLWEVRP